MAGQTFSVPISIEVGVRTIKRYYLNLNGYRNWHHHLSNQLKKAFKIAVADDIRQLTPLTKPCSITYVIYYRDRRGVDIDNIGSVISKFTNDALVELGVLEDDNCNFVKEIHYVFGGVDKDNPRCEVRIEEL